MELSALLLVVYLSLPTIFAEDVSYQACVDKYSRKGYQPWQEWSDHYTCHRYRCEIRDGKYFIAAVGCRKPKIPENALECHEYIEDENVEFPTCCARLRCVVEANGERIVQTRGQPGELFPDKPWKGQQSEPNPAVLGMVQQNTVNGEPQPMQAPQAAPAIFNSRGVADNSNTNDRRNWKQGDPIAAVSQNNDQSSQTTNFISRGSSQGSEIDSNRFMDSFTNAQEMSRRRRSTNNPVFNRDYQQDGQQPNNNLGGFSSINNNHNNNTYFIN